MTTDSDEGAKDEKIDRLTKALALSMATAIEEWHRSLNQNAKDALGINDIEALGLKLGAKIDEASRS